MKFLLAIPGCLVVGLILGRGILLAVRGNPWLAIVGSLACGVAFARIGCQPGESH